MLGLSGQMVVVLWYRFCFPLLVDSFWLCNATKVRCRSLLSFVLLIGLLVELCKLNARVRVDMYL